MFEVILVMVIIMLLIMGIYADYTMVKVMDERLNRLEKRIDMCTGFSNHKEEEK